jgi:hypothetical protein
LPRPTGGADAFLAYDPTLERHLRGSIDVVERLVTVSHRFARPA